MLIFNSKYVFNYFFLVTSSTILKTLVFYVLRDGEASFLITIIIFHWKCIQNYSDKLY